MDTEAIAKALVALETRYWQAMKDRDVDAAMRLTDETCIVTGAQGVGTVDRKTIGQMVSTAKHTLHDFKVSDEVEVRMLRDDVAILAYKVHEELTVDGKHVSLDAADSSLWVLRNGRWFCALHTESLAGDPFGRDRVPRARS